MILNCEKYFSAALFSFALRTGRTIMCQNIICAEIVSPPVQQVLFTFNLIGKFNSYFNMSFSVDNLCRGCMEPYKNVPALLFNKKKKKKSQICANFESLSGLKVNKLHYFCINQSYANFR
jgi:hypothetical protein